VNCGRLYSDSFLSKGMRSRLSPIALLGARLRERPFPAVILDLQRSGSSGWGLCRKIADSISGLPLVVLSASPDVADKVLLLEMGADDYLNIPFSPRELVARLRALMRRAPRISPGNQYVFEDVIVDFSKTEITRGGEKVMVTAKEFKTLEFLTKNPERVISRDELLNEVRGYQNYPCTRTVDNHILRLRRNWRAILCIHHTFSLYTA
jgi:DNA-binding response OmpR family regulator